MSWIHLIPSLNRGQMIATFQHNILQHCWLAFASPSQIIATFQCNILQHSWSSICKLWLNDRNISMQYIATLLATTCCVCLATLVTCYNMLHVANQTNVHALAQHCYMNLANEYNIMQHPQMLHEKFDHFQT